MVNFLTELKRFWSKYMLFVANNERLVILFMRKKEINTFESNYVYEDSE